MAFDQNTPARTFRAAGHTAALAGFMACMFLIAGVLPSGVFTNKRGFSEKGLLILRGVFLTAASLIACGTIRDYRIKGNELKIRRLLGSSRVLLDGVRSVERLITSGPNNARGTGFMGNGWDARIGNYSGYVTDMRFAVVFRTETKTFVISPEDPEKFVQMMNRSFGSNVDDAAGGV